MRLSTASLVTGAGLGGRGLGLVDRLPAGRRTLFAEIKRLEPLAMLERRERAAPATLTGGWDSRLLLRLRAERDLDLSAWTIDMDTGTERETVRLLPATDYRDLCRRTLWHDRYAHGLRGFDPG
jgi:hypothetical protein